MKERFLASPAYGREARNDGVGEAPQLKNNFVFCGRFFGTLCLSCPHYPAVMCLKPLSLERPWPLFHPSRGPAKTLRSNGRATFASLFPAGAIRKFLSISFASTPPRSD